MALRLDRASLMTLIQTLLSPSRILQVSDRRLTRAGEPFDDATNKAVSWCAKFFIAFTGPAFMDPNETLPTSEWIAATMADNGDADGAVGTVVEMLRASLEAQVAALPAHWDKRMTVTMSGFANYEDLATSERVPICYRISNYQRFVGNHVQIHPKPFSDFDVHFARYVGGASNDGAVCYITSGHQLDVFEARLVNKLIRRLLKDENWDGIARTMVFIQRRISKRVTPRTTGKISSVGLDAQVMSLPRLADDDPMGNTLMTDVSTTNLADDRPTFVYMPEAGFDGQVFGPHLVCRGQAMSFEGYEPSPDGDVDKGKAIYRVLNSGRS